ncbi:hypothetical protein NQD34_011588 [Periophthalmus magnuspinnatus]|nr:hypothetical protein NQD34_011588 [Periophthalmus magnuspinnatus]
MLFTDEMILHIAHQTNLYAAHELGDPIKTNPCEIEHFLAMLLFMGVFNFPAMEDYWHPASRFNLIEDEELMKRGCGALHYKSTEGVLAVKWYDNKCVTLLSNASGIKPLTSVQQWSKDAKANIAVQCPSLIAAYNQHMGGIDLSDMLVHLYKTPAKSRRWYFLLFGYALDLCISNSWLIYKRDCDLLKEKPMPLKRFRLAVAHSLKQANKPAPRVGQPSSASSPQMSCEKKRLPPRPPDHNQACASTTMDIGHFTLTTWDGAASAQRVCPVLDRREGMLCSVSSKIMCRGLPMVTITLRDLYSF